MFKVQVTYEFCPTEVKAMVAYLQCTDADNKLQSCIFNEQSCWCTCRASTWTNLETVIEEALVEARRNIAWQRKSSNALPSNRTIEL